MVAPLYVEIAVGQESVEHEVCAVATVEDVAEEVELVYAKVLDDVRYGAYELFRLAGGYYRLDDSVVVGLLVVFGGGFMQ